MGATPSGAQGCGPTRLKVTESVSSDLPPARLWALVGSFQDLAWDSAVGGVSGSGGNAADGAKRTVTLKDGDVLEESLYKYDNAAMSYSYHLDRIARVSALPVQNASATIEVLPGPTGGSKLVWRAAFYRMLLPDEPAPDVADRRAEQAMVNLIRSGLAGLRESSDASKTTKATAVTTTVPRT